MGVELLDVAMGGNTMECFHACMLDMLDMLDAGCFYTFFKLSFLRRVTFLSVS